MMADFENALLFRRFGLLLSVFFTEQHLEPARTSVRKRNKARMK